MPQEIEGIAKAYLAGEDPLVIATAFSIHKNTVYDALEKSGTPLRQQRRGYLREEELKEIKDLYDGGLSFQSIAEQMGLSYATIEKYGKRAGITPRSPRYGKHAGLCCGDCGSSNLIPVPLLENN